MRVHVASCLLLLFGAWVQASGQMMPSQGSIPPVYNQPPPTVDMPYPKAAPTAKIDPAALQREARELLALAQAVQSDINSVNRGVLPKDANDKLKRIEKLSKRLRSEINGR